MRSSKTFSILFWIYASRATDNHAGIYARVTVNGKKVNISQKRKVDVDLWDVKSQRAKGNSKAIQALNQYLDQVYTQLFQCYQELKYKGQLITAELIKAHYCG